MSQITLQKNIMRLMSLLLCLMLFVSCIPAVRADGEGGTCGDGLSWSMNAGTLTITGSGAMTDFTVDAMAPWHSCREEIVQVELPDGLTHIGNLAFYECSNLVSVTIPNTVQTVGEFAFSDCIKLKMLTIGNGVLSIEEAAFQNCTSLKSLTLPNSLIAIGIKAFYRCEEITSLRIPASVKAIGRAAFGYCKNLVSVDMKASVSEISEFLFYGCGKLTSITLPDTANDIEDLAFYGCDQLETVYYNGSNQSISDVEKAMADNQQNTGGGLQVQENPEPTTNTDPLKRPISSTSESSNNGTIIQESITAIQGENVTGSLTVESTQRKEGTVENTDVNITITVEGEDGWKEVGDIAKTLLNQTGTGSQSENVNVDIYLKGTEELDAELLESLAGKKVTLSVTTESGNSWKADCSQLDAEKIPEKLNFTYTLTAGKDELTAELGGNASFVLKFEESAKVNSQVLIRLGSSWSNQGATLFQRDGGGISRIQAALVDRDGYAHFYLASVDKNVEYCIGMNVLSDMETQSPIIPGEMLSDYGNIENFQPIQYEITGRSSSWNMGLGKVMAILAVVMVSAIVVVGAVMFFWNKQRLKNGYVPQWEDEDE